MSSRAHHHSTAGTSPPISQQDQWRLHAACRSHDDPELWFSDSPAHRYNANQLCHQCPVRQDCNMLAAGERWGVWAGHSLDRPDPRLCDECGQPFYPVQSSRYCRKSCGERARRRRQKQRRQASGISELGPVCGHDWLPPHVCGCLSGCPDCEEAADGEE